jgi:hypothetical protein
MLMKLALAGRRIVVAMAIVTLSATAGWAQGKAEKSFQALAIDAKGVETEIKNVIFYWEEKVSETAFVPHELREMPVKRGTATVKIKFDHIKRMEIKPSGNSGLPTVAITLADGKNGEFGLAIAGSFKGQSDFGEVELPAAEMRQIVFK